jgi:hypothetical protein
MRTLLAVLAITASVALAAGTAHACGYCDGDRIAAVYDASVVTGAKHAGNGVVYVGIEGPFGGSASERAAITKAIEGISGVVKGSVFISYSPSAARLVFRPLKGSTKTLVGKASAALKKRTGCTLIVLRVECDKPTR